jgi:hypothetical protein
MVLIELIFRKRPISHQAFTGHQSRPECEAPIEVPQTRHDHRTTGTSMSGRCLIKDEKIEAPSLGGAHASHNLLPPIEAAELAWDPVELAIRL